MRILANDGIDASGKDLLEKAGFTIDTNNIPQAELAAKIAAYDVLIVRSATKVTAEIIDASKLKVIARAGVGTDNIDMKHAGVKGIPVFNTPNASSRSVAELVFAHLFSLARNLQVSNRVMPEKGDIQFKQLKNEASNGFEVLNKKMGIIGFGRIGQEVAKIAVGLGMEVLAHDYKNRDVDLVIQFNKSYQYHNFEIKLKNLSLDKVLTESDFITLHIPGSEPFFKKEHMLKMKKGGILINCSRGGIVDEKDLLDVLNSKDLGGAGIDVFEQEPPVYMDILGNSKVSLSPHIGASTVEAQERVGIELANRIINYLK